MDVVTVGQQATLDGGVVPVKRNHLGLPLESLRLIVARAQVPCSWCDKPILPRVVSGRWQGRRWVHHYDSPWDDAPQIHFYCSEECHDLSEDSSQSDWSYQHCEYCERYIIERCPSNGWHGYFRYGEDGAMCLRCYEESTLENGQPVSDFSGDTVKGGMFFNRGNPELVEAGYECLEEAFIGSASSAADYNEAAREYIINGYQLVTAFESMAIGGLEGSIELWGKRKEGDE